MKFYCQHCCSLTDEPVHCPLCGKDRFKPIIIQNQIQQYTCNLEVKDKIET